MENYFLAFGSFASGFALALIYAVFRLNEQRSLHQDQVDRLQDFLEDCQDLRWEQAKKHQTAVKNYIVTIAHPCPPQRRAKALADLQSAFGIVLKTGA